MVLAWMSTVACSTPSSGVKAPSREVLQWSQWISGTVMVSVTMPGLLSWSQPAVPAGRHYPGEYTPHRYTLPSRSPTNSRGDLSGILRQGVVSFGLPCRRGRLCRPRRRAPTQADPSATTAGQEWSVACADVERDLPERTTPPCSTAGPPRPPRAVTRAPVDGSGPEWPGPASG